jgi:hypothetical protein
VELIRGQTPPTDFCNQRFVSDVRATQPGPVILAGTETAISFLFFNVPSCLPCESVDTRRAALRPFAPTSVLVPLGCPSLPNRDVDSNAPPSTAFTGEV